MTEEDFAYGTYEAGRLLSGFCKEFCQPERRGSAAPCPAFVTDYRVWDDEGRDLAIVEPRSTPELERCAGVQKLLDMTETPAERYFLSTYLRLRVLDEDDWRTRLLTDWNEGCQEVEDDFLFSTRREKFDAAMWRTIRFPALIPQVWLNWLHATSEEHMRALEENTSRVDFTAFYAGARHVVELDGPSHYASYNETTGYAVDERAYARSLKIARSLQREGWTLTRIGRIEVEDAMPADGADEDDFGAFGTMWSLLRILPFPDRQSYPPRPSYNELGLDGLLVAAHLATHDDIPF